MNAQAIWSGHDYAYFELRGRGENYRRSGRRVKAIKVTKRRATLFNEKLSTFVEVQFLNDDSTPRLRDGQPVIKEIRARDIVSLWDEYEGEREYRERESAKLAKEYEAQEEATQLRRTAIVDALESKGIERTSISIDNFNVKIKINVVESWLGLNGN